MRITLAASAGSVALLAALTACAAPGDEPKPTPHEEKASPDKEQAQDEPDRLELGQSWPWKDDDGNEGTASVLSYKQPYSGIEPPDESLGMQEKAVWARVDVKVCIDKSEGENSVSQDPWSLAFADGSQAEITGLSGGDFPKPEYPIMDKVVRAGRCARGGIMFPVPADQRPVRVEYAPEGLAYPTEWRIPKR
ncbi:DUF4352 domain-containing protein [Streptomyces qinglanensis]|uniref:DUF4352 domain-containing protein n=1 Tax=Streptomyces qinglanensis TaxID=943816 RepID=A0A1H9U345_9ACTN|nr:DUF4352 domain-containing protein [Streptomyces qinglanensis]SES03722.1 hypothetical protein SAMN05421870_107265 [Streptomyces qinglanensis]